MTESREEARLNKGDVKVQHISNKGREWEIILAPSLICWSDAHLGITRKLIPIALTVSTDYHIDKCIDITQTLKTSWKFPLIVSNNRFNWPSRSIHSFSSAYPIRIMMELGPIPAVIG